MESVVFQPPTLENDEEAEAYAHHNSEEGDLPVHPPECQRTHASGEHRTGSPEGQRMPDGPNAGLCGSHVPAEISVKRPERPLEQFHCYPSRLLPSPGGPGTAER